jgi:hypothetical protein
MLSIVISMRAVEAFPGADAVFCVWAEGEGIERAAKKAAARPILNRFIDV